MQPGCPCRADIQRRMSQAEGLPPQFSQPKSLEAPPLHMSVNVTVDFVALSCGWNLSCRFEVLNNPLLLRATVRGSIPYTFG